MPQFRKAFAFYEQYGPTPGRIICVSAGRGVGDMGKGGRPAVECSENLLVSPIDEMYVARTGSYREVKSRPRLVSGFSLQKISVGQISSLHIPGPGRVTVTCSNTTIVTEVGDGVIEVEGKVPGIYDVLVECWPYMPSTYQLEVVP